MRHFIAAVLIVLLIIYLSRTHYWKQFSCERFDHGEYLYRQGVSGKPEGYCHIPPADQGLSCQRSSDCEEICNAQTNTCDFFRGGSMDIRNEMGDTVMMAE